MSSPSTSAGASPTTGSADRPLTASVRRAVIYRMRTYTAVPERRDDFTAFFLEHLLPVQRRHGARLVGRWVTTDHRVVADWE